MPLSPDAQTLLLLCSYLGLPAQPEFAPLTLSEWNPLARKLQAASLRPGDLLGLPVDVLQTRLELTEAEASRLARLLERSGALAIALERLQTLGIYPLTRAEAEYPAGTANA
jgi:hypothetical protein